MKEIEMIKKYDSIENGYNVSPGGKIRVTRPTKYHVGDVFGSFEIVGRTPPKFLVQCLDCGAVFERYAGSLQRQGIKCKCKIKYNPNPKKREPRIIEYNGISKEIGEWAKELGIPKETIWKRYLKGHPIDIARIEKGRTATCPTCGTEFKQIRKTKKFCCFECSVEASKKKRPDAICLFCGKTFPVTRAIDKHYKAMFCSIPCRVEYQKKFKTYEEVNAGR